MKIQRLHSYEHYIRCFLYCTFLLYHRPRSSSCASDRRCCGVHAATGCSCGRTALAHLREQVFLQKLIMEPSFGHFNTVKFIYNPKVNSPAEKTRARRVCAHRAVFEQTYPPRILEKSSTCEPFFKSRNKNNSDPPSHTTKGLKPSIIFSSVAFTKEK